MTTTTATTTDLPNDIALRLRSFDSRDAWLEARDDGLGASEIAAAVGASHFQTPLQLFAAKLGIAERTPTARMRWGLLMEPVIAAVYAAQVGPSMGAPREPWLVELAAPCLAQHPRLDWVRATPDAYEVWGDTTAVLDWKIISPYATEWKRQQAPREYEIQVQWQMLATGAPRAALCAVQLAHRIEPDPNDEDAWERLAQSIHRALDSLDPMEAAGLLGVQEVHVRRFTVDEELQAGLLAAGAEFWADVLAARSQAAESGDALEAFHRFAPPAVAADTQTLAEVYRSERMEGAIDVGRDLARSLRDAHAAKAYAQTQFDAAKAAVQRIMGTSTVAMCDGDEIATWSDGERRVFRVK